ncbi:efflux RND transporter periplasmic adaptor subunit [Dokdonella sp.]|uniref:efflux RND transporter periplasmic adaptor subunit n=1 Tax=Dokdonella sp. TaxID=2291710 RepID=UPI0025B9CA43|nr:efflux RND transporter periplasmic adaptor subunit [Dokdonella sp.]MBX3692301.1 efflux RND transporter periplasmic adaptor subunit [Dokdonella sp.]
MHMSKALVLVAGLALAACSRGNAPAAGGSAPSAVIVTTTVIEPSPWVDTIEAIGTSRAREAVTLTAKITETVRKVNFVDGQRVAAGDVLVELTSGQQVAGLAEAQATWRDAERLLKRNEDLVRQGTISRQVFDTAQANHDSSKARVDVLRAQLADRVVTAPFAGVLGLRQVSVGSLVTPGTVITTLDDIDVVNVDFALPERHLAALAPGQAVVAHSDAYPGRRFEGRVMSLDARIDPVTRAFKVRAEIPNADHALRAGMLLGIEVLRPERSVVAVPEIAIVQVGTDSFVFRVDGEDKVARVKVALGARRRGQVEVVEGLDAGTRIVVDGTVKLRDGVKIAEAVATRS